MTADYDAIEAMNWSTLKHLAVSPKMLRWRVDNPRPDTPALTRGRAIHCAVLEPERWASEYRRQPDFGDLRTNRGKAARAEWLAELAGDGCIARPYFDSRTKAGKAARADFEASVPTGVRVLVGDEDAADVLGDRVTVLTADEYDLAERCAEAVREHPKASELLRGGRAEETATWTDEETGVRCKGRLDFVRPVGVLDVKSSRQPTLRQMVADMARLLYHGQLAWYHDGAIASGIVPLGSAELPRVIFVQTVEPYDVVPAFLGPLDLDRGRQLYRSLLRKYVACDAADWWPGMAPDEIELDLPTWAPDGRDALDDGDW